MKRTLQKLGTLMLALAASGQGNAHDFEVDGIYYNMASKDYSYATDTEVCVTSKDGANDSTHEYSGDVVIPETVEYEGVTYTVRFIGNGAFFNCKELTSVEIPNSVILLGDYSFYGCDGLTTVTIPDSVAAIREYAFSACYNLTSVTIGNSVTNIMEAAFRDCESLTAVSLPDTLNQIGYEAFSRCTSLESIVIPASVSSVRSLAFSRCDALADIVVEAVTPPAALSNTFSADTYSSARLQVPGQSVSLYKEAECWKEFYNMEAGIGTPEKDGVTEVGRYNTDGQQVGYDYRGVVVIRYSDGSIRKVTTR